MIDWSIRVPTAHLRTELARFTNMFMQKFVFHELPQLSYKQVPVVKTNYRRMAHRWNKDKNTTTIAARRDVMDELLPQIKGIHSPPTDIVSYTQSYPIRSTVLIPFFADTNPFFARLKKHLLAKCNVPLEIKDRSATQVDLELRGQEQNVRDARALIDSLFASLEMKTYTDENNGKSNTTDRHAETRLSLRTLARKFSIPDLCRVVQWHLDQSLMVPAHCTFSTNPRRLVVRYLANDPTFGVDQQAIDNLIRQTLVNVSHAVNGTTKNLQVNLKITVDKIRQRSDYGQDVCCSYGDADWTSIDLCGKRSIVEQLSAEVRSVLDKYTPVNLDIALSVHQVMPWRMNVWTHRFGCLGQSPRAVLFGGIEKI